MSMCKRPNASWSRRDVLAMAGAAAAVGSASAFGQGAPPPRGRWPVGLVSRHLQWTNLEHAIDVAKAIGFDEIEWNVRVGGHIDPSRVEKELPRAVEMTRKAGLGVTMITTSIADAASPFAEPILATAAGLGIRVYRGGQYFRYDYDGDVAAQLEALKPRVRTLEALNRRYNTCVAYHTHSSRGNIGGNIWDFWTVLNGFDPRFVALNYDIGHATARGGLGWIDAAKVVSPMMRAIAIKDFVWTRGFRDQDMVLRNTEPLPPHPWGVEWSPVGEGMVDFPLFFAYLKSIKFAGPMNLHLEHHNLLGTDLGTWKLDMTEARFKEIVGVDLAFLRKTMGPA
jgi:L-ribulose-5-phosphate 3-epimerase